MKKQLLLIFILTALRLSLFSQIVPDDNFREKINEALGQPPNYEPTIADLNSLSGYLYAVDASIISIEGAQYLVNISGVGLHRNQIINISALSGLTNLTSLNLNDNQICDISALSGLANLISLRLQENQISDISALSGIINLDALYLNENQICDISALSGLINLFYLHLEENQISDISALSGMTHLSGLFLEYNQISNISPLSNLTGLYNLKLNGNQISDISALSGLTNLISLRLQENQISDISPLSNLTGLTSLMLNGNQISDISALSGMTDLYYLSLNDNQISDISPLSDLTSLWSLMLYGNQITDIYALVENVGLGYGDELLLEDNGETNPLSLEAIEAHIPILQSQGFSLLTYPEEPNLNAACYPYPIRYEENAFCNGELSWHGAEPGTTYEVYLGTSNENLISIGEGEFIGDNTFILYPELLQLTEYWWRVKSTTGNEELWSGMWHFMTDNGLAVNNEMAEIPKGTVLESAFPNPFNPTTNISFEIKTNEIGILSIYNIKGEIITSEKFNSGSHNFQWKGDKHASGIYFYKLKTSSYSKVNKMIILK